MFRIMIVCTGNICRSPMAEYMLKNALGDAGVSEVELSSRATTDGEVGHPIDPRAANTLREHGLDATEHVAQQVTVEELAHMDLVLAMDTDHFEFLVPDLAEIDQADRPLLRMFRSFDPAIANEPHDSQGVYDPWYGDAGDFRETWKMIAASLPALVDYVRSNIASRGNR
ncbi:protein tyrosine phosphatase [Arthrobacter sp. MYb211]|uniref:low molecular weight protein-tyrosine-phosphatase n=1 Tax=Micrococcaceae TaxID=1268 RepID=UPI000CFC946F|nr:MULTISPECIES: low molecular weight protein-tyrosine-phosphatase [unclassified Arthrobacter]PQZ99728.1 protein tyrosine phosphatase [Arthrobacter sp. MYb224]PRA05918.1 protein tyrosine phosphatase [Arthrobacter sp. MYb229]PRA11397.1 protein tyrosine phosphatase [Arthrobacter sp. MYb221]PRB52819.1 protein tyrosine phosphatase [Arthrobacter sp. MYb216]PRC07517.1 protein tyrosine phosphatase [Arthrobacter sp. MYb211]